MQAITRGIRHGLGSGTQNSMSPVFGASWGAVSQVFTQMPPSSSMATVTRSGRFVQTKTPGYQINIHRSNRAKEGLYHGKDVQFGNSISHSVKHTKRRWMPNVQNKRVWSYALDNWVRFKMTTRAMRAIDDCGGIDNYLLQLDHKLVDDSNYVTKIRQLIASTLYHKGLLSERATKRMGYHKMAPMKLDIHFDQSLGKYGKWVAAHAVVEEDEVELDISDNSASALA